MKKFIINFQENSFLKSQKILLFFIFYFIFRVIFFDINSAEWGDSYRILRATSFLENLSYPKDEKRPPLFSAFLTLNPSNLDPVYSSRILMIFVSILVVFLFYKFLKIFLKYNQIELSQNKILLGLVLFSFNPLFLYWSLRIYADTFFLLFSLSTLIFLYKFFESKNLLWSIPISILTFLGIMTRFEGYVLAFSIILGLIFKFIKDRDFQVFKFLIFYVFLLLAILNFASNTSWTFYKNPLTSSYVDEAERRDLVALDFLSTTLHILFISGTIFFVYFISYIGNKIFNLFIKNEIIVLFCAAEILLAYLWPAAVPRLLVQIVPFFVIFLVLGISEYLQKNKIDNKKNFLILGLILSTFVFGQYLVKSQLFLTNYWYFFIICCLFLIQSFFIFLKRAKLLFLSIITTSIVWSILFVFLHKDIYKVLNDGVTFFSIYYPKSGLILTNDVSYLTKFYFGENLKYLREVDFGIDIKKFLIDRNASYLIVTNEHNPDMKYSPEKYPYLEVIYEKREVINGREFFVVISKVNLE